MARINGSRVERLNHDGGVRLKGAILAVIRVPLRSCRLVATGRPAVEGFTRHNALFRSTIASLSP